MRPALTFENLQVCNEKDKIAIFCNLSLEIGIWLVEEKR